MSMSFDINKNVQFILYTAGNHFCSKKLNKIKLSHCLSMMHTVNKVSH